MALAMPPGTESGAGNSGDHYDITSQNFGFFTSYLFVDSTWVIYSIKTLFLGTNVERNDEPVDLVQSQTKRPTNQHPTSQIFVPLTSELACHATRCSLETC